MQGELGTRSAPGAGYRLFWKSWDLLSAAPQALQGVAKARQGSSVPHSLLILTSSLERLGRGGTEKYGLDLLVFPF